MRLALLLVLGFGAALLLVRNTVAQTENIEGGARIPLKPIPAARPDSNVVVPGFGSSRWTG